MGCSDPMLQKQPHSEEPVEASAPSSDEMKKKTDEPVDELDIYIYSVWENNANFKT